MQCYKVDMIRAPLTQPELMRKGLPESTVYRTRHAKYDQVDDLAGHRVPNSHMPMT